MSAGVTTMGRWRSEYRRTHRGQTADQLLATWRDNLTERRHLRDTMMSSHFQLGVGSGSSSSSSTESLSGYLSLSPTRLRLRHLALTSPERAPPAPPAVRGRSVRFEAPSESERPAEATERPREATERPREATERPREATERPREATERPREATERPREATERPREATERPREATERPAEAVVQARHAPTSSEAPGSSSEPPSHTGVDQPRPSAAPASPANYPRLPAAGGRQRQRSPGPLGPPLVGYGHGERGCDVGEQRTYNVMAPTAQVHETARAAAERRRTAQGQRDAALDAVLSHDRPPPRPASRWTTEYQRVFCQPVWAAERVRRRQ